MQNYTLTVLINEKVSEADRNSTFEAIKKHFTTLIKEDMWGVRSLAYEIKHAGKAFYAFFEFEAGPEAIITLDKNIRLNEDIVRYLIVKVKKIKAKKARIVKEPKDSDEAKAAEGEPRQSRESGVVAEKTEAEVEVKEPKVKKSVKIKAKSKE